MSYPPFSVVLDLSDRLLNTFWMTTGSFILSIGFCKMVNSIQNLVSIVRLEVFPTDNIYWEL